MSTANATLTAHYGNLSATETLRGESRALLQDGIARQLRLSHEHAEQLTHEALGALAVEVDEPCAEDCVVLNPKKIDPKRCPTVQMTGAQADALTGAALNEAVSVVLRRLLVITAPDTRPLGAGSYALLARHVRSEVDRALTMIEAAS